MIVDAAHIETLKMKLKAGIEPFKITALVTRRP
jgi:hypothetical protein